MRQSSIVLVGAFSLFIGVGLIDHVDAQNKDNHSHQNSDSMMHNSQDHQHKTLSIPTGEQVPTVDLVVSEDPVRGWNLEIKTSNFEFAPENVNGQSSYNEGHAHLYVNGEMRNRIYGNWFHLIGLEPGENEIKVVLNANGHETLMYQDQPIEASEVILVEGQ